MDTLMTQLYMNVGTVLISILGAFLLHLIQAGKVKAESAVAQVFPQEDAVKVNDLLDAIDLLAEAAVQDANSRIVNGLKVNNLFTPEVAAATKTAVVNDVLANLEPLKEKAMALIGPLEAVVGRFVEKHVVSNKTKTPA